MFLDRVIHFGETLGDQVKGRSPKRLKSLIDLCSSPESTGSKLQYVFVSSPRRVPRPSYLFRGKIGGAGRGSITEIAEIVNSSSRCSAHESTDSKLQYVPFIM